MPTPNEASDAEPKTHTAAEVARIVENCRAEVRQERATGYVRGVLSIVFIGLAVLALMGAIQNKDEDGPLLDSIVTGAFGCLFAYIAFRCVRDSFKH